MASKKEPKTASVQAVAPIAQRVADEMGLELVEIALQKEPRGKVLCLYMDKQGGLSLDDCELFHKAVQPLLEQVEYDFLEVSSPGLDRPVKTQRDFEKNRGALVEVRLFTKVEGQKAFQGTLEQMDDAQVTIRQENGDRSFPRASVALIKPIIIFDEDEEE